VDVAAPVGRPPCEDRGLGAPRLAGRTRRRRDAGDSGARLGRGWTRRRRVAVHLRLGRPGRLGRAWRRRPVGYRAGPRARRRGGDREIGDHGVAPDAYRPAGGQHPGRGTDRLRPPVAAHPRCQRTASARTAPCCARPAWHAQYRLGRTRRRRQGAARRRLHVEGPDQRRPACRVPADPRPVGRPSKPVAGQPHRSQRPGRRSGARSRLPRLGLQ